MKAAGYYDAHSEYQRRVIEGGDELIADAAGGLDLAAIKGAATFVDYGAGTGATSVHAMRTAIAALRESGSDVPVLAVHNDVESNDFGQLLQNVSGEGSYLELEGGPIYPAAIPGSFFGQVVPSGAVQLGLCSNASHWLREQPRGVSLPAGMYFCDAAGSARELLAGQAAADWTAFLGARAEELAPGGRFVVQGIASSDDGERVSASKLLIAMWKAAEALAEEGSLDREVLDGYVFPVYCRSPSEAKQPLAAGGPLEGRLRVEAERFDEVPNPYWETFERQADAAAYARTYVEFVRAFSESSLLSGLFALGALSGEPAALCDEFFERLRADTETDPEAGRYEAWVLRLTLERPAG